MRYLTDFQSNKKIVTEHYLKLSSDSKVISVQNILYIIVASVEEVSNGYDRNSILRFWREFINTTFYNTWEENKYEITESNKAIH